MKRISIILTLLLTIASFSPSQEIYYYVSNHSVYDFLDEIANLKIIELNSAVKPYSRLFIAKKLDEISQKATQPTSTTGGTGRKHLPMWDDTWVHTLVWLTTMKKYCCLAPIT